MVSQTFTFFNIVPECLNHAWMNLRLIVFVGTLGITQAFACVNVELDQLIRNPTAFDGQCVCVAGVTEGDGINFALFRPPHPSQGNRVILVVNKQEGPRYKPVDGHWVNVCGTVTADERKLFACKLILEDARPLNKPPIPGRRVFGIFENKGPETVRIETMNKTGNESTEMILAPGELTKTVITEGKVRVSALSKDLSPIKLLSTSAMPTVHSARNYFETATRTFYFSLTDGKMLLLKPNKAAEMRKRWEALEKKEE
jgi:hypothetical protein